VSDRANRSFEIITRDDLERLGQLALSNFDDFFRRNPDHPYLARLRLICLLQTAAKHYVEPDHCRKPNQRCGGVNDFDVCGFFDAVASRRLYSRRKCQLDFGSSKFGRNPDDGERFNGRRVDVMWRSIKVESAETPIQAMQRYLQNASPNSSAGHWKAKPVVIMWPRKLLGHVIWQPE
jgi:hypothetical protein